MFNFLYKIFKLFVFIGNRIMAKKNTMQNFSIQVINALYLRFLTLFLNYLYLKLYIYTRFLDLILYIYTSFLDLKLFLYTRFINSYVIRTYQELQQHPKYFLYLHIFKLIVFLLTLFVYSYAYDVIFLFEIHLLLLVVRGFLIIISLLLRTKYIHYIYWLYFLRRYGQDINDKKYAKKYTPELKQFLEGTLISRCSHVFILYVWCTNWCHVVLILLWIVYQMHMWYN